MELPLCLAYLVNTNRDGTGFDPISCQVLLQLLKWWGTDPSQKSAVCINK